MMESAEQMPHLTQTAIGGKRMAMRPRKMSDEHIVDDWMGYWVEFRFRDSMKGIVEASAKLYVLMLIKERFSWKKVA